MAESETADAQSIIAPLAAWLEARTPGASNLTLHDAAQPSQGYANLTISFVARWTEGGQPRRVEVVLVSRDQDADRAAEYRAKMPWSALPHEHTAAVCDQLGVKTIPALMAFDNRTGACVSRNAVSSASSLFFR